MMGYGKRFCLVCGKEYEAEYASQLVCCKECKRSRVRMQVREKRGGADIEMEWLNCQYERLLESVRTVVGDAVARKPEVSVEKTVEAIAGPPADKPKEEIVKEDEDKYPAKSKKKLKEGERYCAVCGDVFYSRDKTEKYCCSSCRLVARRKGIEE